MILFDPALKMGAAKTGATANGAGRTDVRASAVPWRERIPSAKTLEKFAAEAQAAVRLRGEVSVLLTTDRAIRKLNRDYRGKDKATDVLSFPAEAGFVEAEIVGDLAISVDTARKQARAEDHALTCELKVLVLHGMLHLAGYDHETDTGQMARRERKLRERLRLPVGLIERAESKTPRAVAQVKKKKAAAGRTR